MGKLVFQVTGAFAEFERSMIRQRINAGLRRAVAKGTRLGRPPIKPELEERIREALKGGLSIRKTAAKFGVNKSTVQRVATLSTQTPLARSKQRARRPIAVITAVDEVLALWRGGQVGPMHLTEMKCSNYPRRVHPSQAVRLD